MAEKKNKNPFKFKPFARLVFSCNELPRNYVDRTEGFYRRLIIVPFSRQIEKSKIDKSLKYKFQREKEGILNWALEGLKRLYENNFEFSENELTDGVKKEYKRENNNVISFVEECCEIDSLFSCSRIEIYEAYKDRYAEKARFKLSMIQVGTKEEAEGILSQIKSAEDFANAAKAESLHEVTKANGGEIKNPVIRGGFIADSVGNSPQAWGAIGKTSQGATDIVEVNQQFYIFWVHDRTPERQRPFTEVKEQVEADYRRERQEQAAQDLLNRTLEEQQVEIYADKLLK